MRWAMMQPVWMRNMLFYGWRASAGTSGPGMCLMGRFFSSKLIAISIISFMLTISDEPRFSGCTHACQVSACAQDRCLLAAVYTASSPSDLRASTSASTHSGSRRHASTEVRQFAIVAAVVFMLSKCR